MLQNKIECIALEVERVVFDESPYCTIIGKAYETNGFYYVDTIMKLTEFYTLLNHNGNTGKMIIWAVSQHLDSENVIYPIVVDVVQQFNSALFLNADKLELNKVSAFSKKTNQIHYCLRLENFVKLSKLNIAKNLITISHLTSIPKSRTIIDCDDLQKAYSLYHSYLELDINEKYARQRSGLLHPALFELAHFTCCA